MIHACKKTAILFAGIFIYLLLSYPFISSAQFAGSPRRMIIFSPVNSGELFILREKATLGYRLSDTSPLEIGQVSRIRQDSVYIENDGHRVPDFFEIRILPFPHNPPGPFSHNENHNFSEGVRYSRSYPITWHIFYPPDSLYPVHGAISRYIHSIRREMTDEKMNYCCNPLDFKNFLKVNIAKLVHLEVAAAYERRIGTRVSWETEVGYQFGIRSADAHYNNSYPLYNYNGLTFLTYPKFYLKGTRIYLGIAALYKYLYFTDVRTSFHHAGGEGGALEDQTRHDFGLSIRVGNMKRNGNFIVDWYIGLGYKIALIHAVDHGSYFYHDSMDYHEYDMPEVSDFYLFMPIVNAGIKIGGCF
jgi:hypothetical protein